MKRITQCALLFTLLIAVSCEDSTAVEDYGSMSASVDGAPFSANLRTSAKFAQNVLTMLATQGENPTRQINIIVKGMTGVGDYLAGPDSPALIAYTETVAGVTLGWTSVLSGGAGTISVTEAGVTAFGANSFKGSFSGITLVPSLGGATGNKTIASGTFDVEIR